MTKKSKRVIDWRKRTKEKMVKSMGGACQICGYDKCHSALEFHHIDPTKKDFGFGAYRANPKKLSKLKEELKKCIMLCANCHREVHDGMVGIPETYFSFDESFLIGELELRRKVKQQQAEHCSKYPIDRRKLKLTEEELVVLLGEHKGNKSSLARYLGVSETAIRKKLKRQQPG